MSKYKGVEEIRKLREETGLSLMLDGISSYLLNEAKIDIYKLDDCLELWFSCNKRGLSMEECIKEEFGQEVLERIKKYI
ncbi:hypothetical protein PG614_10205 [Riemerella anatipestifer]|nr:hypothetical protein [Riemerella anatipestifer]MDY3534268.1 hypothetical protein [Riemerella anatipestifer]MDY3536318.1 hypothetical protein [Riemerella anatipestifer]